MRSDQYIATVLEKCAGLQRSGLWPPEGEGRIRPRAWIHNFQDSEHAIAAVLLDHFTFFSSQAVHHMLLSGFRALRSSFATNLSGSEGFEELHQAVFTSVEGEEPNVTDSGKLICRKLRQLVGIPEQRFLEPAQALIAVANGGHVVFLDDFVGSGDQFLSTWTRQLLPTSPRSFAEAVALGTAKASYLTLVATGDGIDRIRQAVPAVRLVTSHCLRTESSVRRLPRYCLQPDIPDLPTRIEELLEKYAARLILPLYMTNGGRRKYGYAELGLSLAFDHSTPDASLPILWADGGSGWTPLVRRS